MLTTAILASLAIALSSVVGALFFGNSKELQGLQKFVVPVAVGMLLSFVLYELLPETFAASPEYGGLMVAVGFIGFYILANFLHQRFHNLADGQCERKTAASLLLTGDAVHNLADGVILGSAFLIDPAVGVATGVAIALHEIPQEIIEFGVLIRAGYSRTQAMTRNLLSASTVVVGTIGTILISDSVGQYLWVVTGLAAGNLLFVAASELLPRIHGNLKNYGNIWKATAAIVFGFIFMTLIISWAHEQAPHAHDHTNSESHKGHDH